MTAARVNAARWGAGRWAGRWWVQVLAVHAAARLFGMVLLLVVARTQAGNPWTGPSPSYPQYTGLMWDASWYRSIAEDGYPSELPHGPDGRVQQNAWAFFPLFPLLCRTVMRLTGGSWEVVAPTVSLLLGATAMLVVHRVVVAVLDPDRPGAPTGRAGSRALPERVRRRLPLATVAVLTTSAAAPVLQVAYTESLALLLLATVLWCVLRERLLLATLPVLALGLTRAVALPLLVVLLAHGLTRWWSGRSWPVADRVRLAALGVVTLASGLLWPALCGWVTGRADAYTQTQGAWRGRGEVVPVLPWIDVVRWLWGGAGVVVLLVAVALTVLLVAAGPMVRLGPELRAWTGGYLGYLFVVVEPGTSLVRFGLLAFPVAAAAALLALRSRWPRAALAVMLVLGLVTQVAWVALVWRLVPPAGWPP